MPIARVRAPCVWWSLGSGPHVCVVVARVRVAVVVVAARATAPTWIQDA